LGNFTLLSTVSNFANHIRTAVQVKWSDFVVSGGVLQNDSQLIAKFASLGVSPAKMVVVYGSWASGWGDEGRIHWMLKYLGHTQAYILAGGGSPYLQAHPENSVASNVSAPIGVSISEWQTGLAPASNILAMKADIAAGNVLVIDTRTLEEYDGTLLNPTGTGAAYGVQRLGHAAGAVSFPYPKFFSSDGCLLSCTDFKAKLAALGWTQGKKLVSYCTAGIRSAFFWSVVQNCGLGAAANYAGSMLEYAADSSLPMEITGGKVTASWGGQRSAGCLATASILVVLEVVRAMAVAS